MKLYRLKVEGFRRIYDAEFMFGEATFIIGVNNVGKSSVLKAIEYLLSDKKKLEESDYYTVFKDGENKRFSGKVVFEAEFRMSLLKPQHGVDLKGAYSITSCRRGQQKRERDLFSEKYLNSVKM